MNTLLTIYELLYNRYGPQRWWPGESRFEIIIGAILTQNTNWQNVEKAIANLKSADLMCEQKLYTLSTPQLAELIRPAGYYNIKAVRIKNFLKWLFENHDGSLESLERLDTHSLRAALIGIKGIGPETADSITLYAFNKPVFVVDAYTARVAIRHRLIEYGTGYDALQESFTSGLPQDTRLFNEYHALLVRVGKDHCRKIARCSGCPLEDLPHDTDEQEY
ncbi:MAG: endonuclease III domain-containing protein [Sedimentisphaerales bacterium]|nr:endonuclease III domain-containing protein [Sedimentisphaerales bacterium]